MLRLVELHVRKFRDLVDGGPLRFGPGPVFLLGPNGSGKTTLLELIAVLLGDDLGPLFKEEDAVELSWVLEAEGVGETPTTRLELSLSIDPVVRANSEERTARRAKRGWKISGTIPARTPHEESILVDQTPQKLRVRLASGIKVVFDLFDAPLPTDPRWLMSLSIDLSVAVTEYAEDIIGGDRLEVIDELLSVGPTLRFDEALIHYDQVVGVHENSIVIEDPAGDDSPSHDFPEWVNLDDDDESRSSNHPDIQLLTRLLGAERIDIRPKLILKDEHGRRRWRGFDFFIHWGGGAIHHHSQLSFGQKRLIALVWHIGLNPDLPLLTDEMTNGLHAGWVQAIIDHLRPRQGFHAVQNPLLLDRYGPGEGPEEIAGRFVICTVEPGERGRQWRWRSPTPVECERLWAAYIAGYQHLSELLISEGLW